MNEKTSMKQKLTKKELAHDLRYSTRTIEKWMKLGILTYTKVHGRVWFNKEEVDRELTQFVHKSRFSVH